MDNRLKIFIEKIIGSISADDKTVIVLKGLPLPDGFCPDLVKLAANKLGYLFNDILRAERHVITCEEFLMLRSFILEQYDRIIILNDNRHADKYPLEN